MTYKEALDKTTSAGQMISTEEWILQGFALVIESITDYSESLGCTSKTLSHKRGPDDEVNTKFIQFLKQIDTGTDLNLYYENANGAIIKE